MGRITLLNEKVAEQIAAGEVVDTPASVVKELVENSLDAGSDNIQINISKAGKELIRVIDNGNGIHPEDAKLAFSRHATSKVEEIYDLEDIRTLGFRGEALASIAAVSRVELKSRPPDNKAGINVVVEGGDIREVSSAGNPIGTDIAVKDLFYNTPARLKFLRKEATEIAAIQDMVNKLALAHPEVRFTLINGKNKLLQTSGRNDLLEVFASIYGYQSAKKLIPIHVNNNGITISGFISRPELTRSNRSYQTFFVNGRYIKSTSLSESLEKGYHTLLPKQRYPVAILKLNIPNDKLDVNVHPAKIHVRFADQKSLTDLLTRTVNQKLQNEQLIPQVSHHARKEDSPVAKSHNDSTQLRMSASEYQSLSRQKNRSSRSDYDVNNQQSKFDNRTYENRDIYQAGSKTSSNQGAGHEKSLSSAEADLKAEIQTREDDDSSLKYDSSDHISDSNTAGKSIAESTESTSESDQVLGLLLEQGRIVGQIFATYWIVELEKEIYYIDQHAAHERVNYHEMMDRYQNTEIKSQQVIPYTVEVNSADIAIIEENLDTLNSCGLEIEVFGKHTLLVRAIPFAIKDIFDQQAILDLIDQLVSYPETSLDLNQLEEMLIMVACKKSIKANQSINKAEFVKLLQDLYKTPKPFTCPHGRPTLVKMSKTDIEKLFYRT